MRLPRLDDGEIVLVIRSMVDRADRRRVSSPDTEMAIDRHPNDTRNRRQSRSGISRDPAARRRTA